MRCNVYGRFLAHEVGTHLLRWLNEEQQPWHGNRAGYNLPPVGRTRAAVQTEEGLATCNQLLFAAHPPVEILQKHFFQIDHTLHLHSYGPDPHSR